ncbi:uncharacterized protein K452DRAFT_59201 [Aplosporella prunicola CBS 121167]|uniref:Uncharacterized protein n=1 Tax=Aplosporella prunicola CBS 121167 TaxID=1176127 RepID=A0A6A6B9V0_9PEZI|nr:uncharacterized protein K452DRAFT_59201 [Aplosporella prunicola CBS 121167]KAF2140004.1 hypothetical protein K452DRAFT_59201 [Aplosporella prunicola CBS 121167]
MPCGALLRPQSRAGSASLGHWTLLWSEASRVLGLELGRGGLWAERGRDCLACGGIGAGKRCPRGKNTGTYLMVWHAARTSGKHLSPASTWRAPSPRPRAQKEKTCKKSRDAIVLPPTTCKID